MLQFWHFIREKTNKNMLALCFSDKFDKKYDYDDLLILAFILPKNVKLTYPDVLKVYPIMSKRHIYDIIEIRKDLYNKLKKNTLKYS